jgi:triphosphoribosyl-dephospho-CoA synthase
MAELACAMEVLCPKPGNVSPGRPFKYLNEMSFVASAMASASAFADGAASAGRLALGAVRAVKAASGRNVNLGIILLLSPLVRAVYDSHEDIGRAGGFRTLVGNVLNGLGPDDSEAIYEAIRLMSPEGLGESQSYDVNDRESDAPPILEAMRLASRWDSVAGEYASAYEITFGLTKPSISAFWKEGRTLRSSILQTFLVLLREVPDTLIARKLGANAAEEVSAMARSALGYGGCFTERGSAALSEMGAALRDRDNLKNPGTTADLMVSGIFAFLEEELKHTPLPDIIDRWDEMEKEGWT